MRTSYGLNHGVFQPWDGIGLQTETTKFPEPSTSSRVRSSRPLTAPDRHQSHQPTPRTQRSLRSPRFLVANAPENRPKKLIPMIQRAL